MPQTAFAHFESDLERTRQILAHGRAMQTTSDAERLLQDDLFRSAWMFGVGAMDAYFCDAYISLLTRTLTAKSLQPTVKLPDFARKIELPVGAILQQYQRDNWRWRMAVRGLMEKDNVLQTDKIRKLFNPFVRANAGRKLFNEITETWAARADATARMFGVTPQLFQAQFLQDAGAARKAAGANLAKRVKSIIQRRHDCIHNCDRPRSAPQTIRAGTSGNAIRDVEFFVTRCDELFDAEYPLFLTRIGADAITRNKLRL